MRYYRTLLTLLGIIFLSCNSDIESSSSCITARIKDNGAQLKESLGGYLEATTDTGSKIRCTAKFQPIHEGENIFLRTFTARHCFVGEVIENLTAFISIGSEKAQYISIDMQSQYLSLLSDFFEIDKNIGLAQILGNKSDFFGKARLEPIDESIMFAKLDDNVRANYLDPYISNFQTSKLNSQGEINSRQSPFGSFQNGRFASSILQYYADQKNAFESFVCQNTENLIDKKILKTACFMAKDLDVYNLYPVDTNLQEKFNLTFKPEEKSEIGQKQTEIARNRNYNLLKFFAEVVNTALYPELVNQNEAIESIFPSSSMSNLKLKLAELDSADRNLVEDYLRNLTELTANLNGSYVGFNKANNEDYFDFWNDTLNLKNFFGEHLYLETNIVEKDKDNTEKFVGFKSTNFADLIDPQHPVEITPLGLIFRYDNSKIDFDPSDSGSILSLKGLGPILALTNVDNNDVSNQGVTGENFSISLEQLKQLEDPPEPSEYEGSIEYSGSNPEEECVN